MDVTVYTRPGCPYSLKLRAQLRLGRIRFRSVNIWADPEAAALVRAVNGGDETVPTVRVGDAWLTNPSLRDLKAHL